MIATLLTELASVTLIANEDEGSALWLLALGPAGAGAAYFGLWRYYRNTHKSHSFENETTIASQPATGHDAKVKAITGIKSSRIDGENRTDHRRRVNRLN